MKIKNWKRNVFYSTWIRTHIRLVALTRIHCHFFLSFYTNKYLIPNKGRYLRYVGIISRFWIPTSLIENTEVGTLANSRSNWKLISHLHTKCWYMNSNLRKSRRSLLTVYRNTIPTHSWVSWVSRDQKFSVKCKTFRFYH